MRGRNPSRRARRGAGRSLVALALLIGLPAAAEAQVVQDCQPNQYLDRTATGADREIAWTFGVDMDSERCLQVRAGQTVFWNGDLELHPLGGSGGNQPNPIGLHHDGSVTFTTPGTYGFVCLSHSAMKGAIKVIAAAPPTVVTPAPAVSPWLAAGLTGLLMGGGLLLLRSRRHSA